MTLWVGERVIDQVSLNEVNGETQVPLTGEQVALIQGQAELTVGYTNNGNGRLINGQWEKYVDAGGNPVDPATPDVVIGAYRTIG